MSPTPETPPRDGKVRFGKQPRPASVAAVTRLSILAASSLTFCRPCAVLQITVWLPLDCFAAVLTTFPLDVTLTLHTYQIRVTWPQDPEPIAFRVKATAPFQKIFNEVRNLPTFVQCVKKIR